MADIFGTVSPPPFMAITKYGSYQTGITAFISNLLKFLTIIAGVWALFNLIMAGFQYLSSQGDPKMVENAWKQIYMSLMGMVVIVVAYALTALISYILFGDASIILNPKIYGPGIQ
jgi:uncharacterized membrane protein